MSVTIHPLVCGTLTAALAAFEEGGGDEPVTVPVPVWVVRHPRGTVLFDTGMHVDLSRPSDKLDLVSLFFAVDLDDDRLVANRLAAADIAPDDVDVVVLSHLHFDHTGGLHQIPDARVVVQAEEWRHGADPDLAAANSFIQDEFLLGHDVETVDGEHDLFGDGSVTCIPTGGHTPGHQSLRVRLDSGEVVLAADCAYFDRTIDGGPLPAGGFDRQAHARSVAWLAARRAAGARVVAGHDADVLAALPDVLR